MRDPSTRPVNIFVDDESSATKVFIAQVNYFGFLSPEYKATL